MIIWAFEGNKEKLGRAYNLLVDNTIPFFVSVVSYWEIVIKTSLGKLSIPNNFTEMVQKNGFLWLYVEPAHIDMLAKLPMLHSDPFDRLLIAQAKATGLELLTHDEKIKLYF